MTKEPKRLSFLDWVMIMAAVVALGLAGGYVAYVLLGVTAAIWEPLSGMLCLAVVVLFFAGIFWVTDRI